MPLFLAGILQWLGGLLGGPFAKAAVDAYKAKLESQNSADAHTTQLVARELAVEQREKELAAQIVIEEQGRWYTALPRPAFAFAVVIFVWKILVIDKVVGPGCLIGQHWCWDGVTTLPAPEIMQWCGIIVTAYFGGRTIEKVASIITARKK